MRKIKFDYVFLLFLTTYLRNIDLSLDRSWDCWKNKELLNYYRDLISPLSVAKLLQEKSAVVLNDTDISLMAEEENFHWLKRLIYCIIPLRTLSEEQVRSCTNLLLKVDSYLESDVHQYISEIQYLRCYIAHFYAHTLRFRIRTKDYFKMYPIEHFNSNENVKPTKFEEISKIARLYQLLRTERSGLLNPRL